MKSASPEVDPSCGELLSDAGSTFNGLTVLSGICGVLVLLTVYGIAIGSGMAEAWFRDG
jgi:hypothetical protein